MTTPHCQCQIRHSTRILIMLISFVTKIQTNFFFFFSFKKRRGVRYFEKSNDLVDQIGIKSYQ